MRYTDKSAIENYLLVTIDDAFDAQLDEWILAVSRTIDKMANRVIFRDTPETYTFEGNGTRILQIGDWNNITELKVDGVVLTAYTLYPQNKPYASRVALTDRTFTRGGVVTITGIPAMTNELPEDIKLAATMMVAEIVKNNMPEGEGVTNEKIGNYQAQYGGGTGELVALDQAKSSRESPKEIVKRYARIAI